MAITLNWSGRRYRVAALLFSVTCVCFFGSFHAAVAQAPAAVGPATNEPPLYPPVVRQLPDGAGTFSLGDWLLYPMLSLRTFTIAIFIQVRRTLIATGGSILTQPCLLNMIPVFIRRRFMETSPATSIRSLINE